MTLTKTHICILCRPTLTITHYYSADLYMYGYILLEMCEWTTAQSFGHMHGLLDLYEWTLAQTFELLVTRARGPISHICIHSTYVYTSIDLYE